MQKSPTCKYLDHGNTAPTEYGRYCIVNETKPINISESACDECNNFTPKIMSFEAWYLEIFLETLKNTDYDNIDVYNTFSECWDAALAVARRRGMM